MEAKGLPTLTQKDCFYANKIWSVYRRSGVNSSSNSSNILPLYKYVDDCTRFEIRKLDMILIPKSRNNQD